MLCRNLQSTMLKTRSGMFMKHCKVICLFHTCRSVSVCHAGTHRMPHDRAGHVCEALQGGLFHTCRSVSLSAVQEPIERHVIEQGMFVKHCKVEVYLMDLKLSENSDINTVVTKQFSRAATIGESAWFEMAVVAFCILPKPATKLALTSLACLVSCCLGSQWTVINGWKVLFLF